MKARSVCHVINGSIEKSSRVFTQSKLDNGMVLDCTKVISFSFLYQKPKARIYVFHQHAMLVNLIFFYIRCVFLSNKQRPEIIFDIHDLNELKGKGTFRNHVYCAFHSTTEKIVFMLPELRFMTVSRGLSKLLFIKYGKSAFVNPNICQPINTWSESVSEKKITNRVVYFGQLNASRLPLKTIEKLESKGFSVDVFGVFKGHESVKYQAELEKRYPSCYKGEYRADNIQKLISLYKFSILSIDSTKLNIRYCLPNKLFQSLSVGLPCIISPNLREINIRFKGQGIISMNEVTVFSEVQSLNYNDYYKKVANQYLQFIFNGLSSNEKK